MMRKNTKIRVAKYKRVSHDEQKLKRNSIIAQDEILDKFIEENPDYVLVGDFSDEGVSGTKIKRTELQTLLEMVENDEVDLILVTKLDRWFRNVAFYYRIQEILDRNRVSWKAVLEDYDTLTADGRFKVNIMLSVAQNETDRTSERIKVVFDSKVRNKQAITGAQPYGFTTTEGNGARKVIRDPETEHIVRDYIDRVLITNSLRASLLYVNEKYDILLGYNQLYNLMKNTMLYGEYRGQPDYCEAYMTKAEFEHLQTCIKRNVKKYDSNRSYIFSGLLICPECGRRLSGYYVKHKRKNDKVYVYYYYRCQRSKLLKDCIFKKSISQNAIEKKLLDELMPQFENLILETEVEGKKKGSRVNKTAIRDEMDRLNKMYQKGRIDEAEYDRKYETLEKKLNVKEEQPKDYTNLKELLDTDFKSLYKTFTDQEKQIFWRSIIDTIEFKGDDIVINFL